jgi:wyosine [tRNA(Phe)-imidazoG37] synthetase (radical SAM superfamily)
MDTWEHTKLNEKAIMKTVYGPVPSWRLGSSLGVDLICGEKTCSFDCIYCQLGRTLDKTSERKIFVETSRVEKDLEEIIEKIDADVITFSGTGEPTLAENLGDVIDLVRNITDMPLAILTNSSLLHRADVRMELKKLDIVVAKLDAPNEKIFGIVDKPVDEINFDMVLDGIQRFRDGFDGKFSLQSMFVKENERYAGEIVELAGKIDPDEIQINTPLRTCPVKPLGKDEIGRIKKKFHGLNAISVYDREKFQVYTSEPREVLRRRPE